MTTTSKKRKLTLKMLQEHLACDRAYKRFRKLFGGSVSVTEANVLRYLGANDIPRRVNDLSWITRHCVSSEAAKDFLDGPNRWRVAYQLFAPQRHHRKNFLSETAQAFVRAWRR